MFLKPIKKSKAFVSEVKTKHGKPFTIKLMNVRIQDIFNLKDNHGQLLHIAIGTDSCAFSTIRTLDEKALQETLQRRNLWFPESALSKEKVLKYFRHSISHDTNTLSVVVSPSQEPTKIEWHGEPMECFESLIGKGKRALRDAVAHMTVEAAGIFFYEQKFGIRWVLRSVSFTNGLTDVSDQDASIDKEDIETLWAEELADLSEVIEDDISLLESKIKTIRTEKQIMQKLLNDAMGCVDMSQQWNVHLTELRERVAKYRGGML